MAAPVELVRRCPGCGTESAPSVMRCVCGLILAGVDIVSKQSRSAEPQEPAQPQVEEAAKAVLCPHEDCGQSNPPGTTSCVYCNRPLSLSTEISPSEPLQSLVNLPAALRDRYSIVKPMPTRGAEAELLVVQAISGGPHRVAKVYRHGIQPKREVQERINKVPVAHRVNVLEAGVSDGYAYELMELCEHGSLRQMLDGGALAPATLRTVISELAAALRGVHAAGLVHRDLKPENILVRAREPLQLVLTDFSISSILDVTKRYTGVARTLPYASPESLSGVIDFKCDYWSMGMLLLECAQGRHPFAGLSEAVVMHHLTTRNVDLIEVAGHDLRDFRKLLLGLLQRDPSRRWGAAEIERWLQNDPTLAEPAQQDDIKGFNEPYHVADEACYRPEQLAVALSRHWKVGRSDISNGLLLAWFRDVQKDQNVVRLLIDMRNERAMPLDRQLLKLILHLAPGIAPVWKGETIALPTILAQANKALKGEMTGEKDAAHWLSDLYLERVLNTYAEAGNAEAAELVKRWDDALERFNEAWSRMQKIIHTNSAARDPDEVANFDDLVFGRNELPRPGVLKMHARVLALAYDATWAERLRERMLAELAGLAAQASWVHELGDPRQMDGASLLVIEALLPEAKKSAEHQMKKSERKRDDLEVEITRVRDELHAVIAEIRHTASTEWATSAVCEGLRMRVDQCLRLVTTVLASGRSDAAWLDLKQQAARVRRNAFAMMEALDKLSRHRAISAGWLSAPVIVFAALIIFLLPLVFPGIRPLFVLAALAIVAWRLIPDYWMMQSIKDLGAAF